MPTSLFPNATPEARARLEQDPTIRLLNTFDWSNNPLGPIPQWTESLKSAVRTMMVATTPMAMLVGERGILLYNNGYAEFAGPRHPDIFGVPAEDAWPEIADFNRENVARGLRGEGVSFVGQHLMLNRHGELEPVWLDLHYSPLFDDAAEPFGTVCVVIDVTTRVLAEQALARSEERLSLAINGTDLVGTWDWDVEANSVTSDDRFAKLFNLDPLRAGFGVPIEDFLRAIHPDDVERVGVEIQAAIDQVATYKSEYRLVAPDGSISWVVASGRPRAGEDGKVRRFPGVVFDVTEQHRYADALAKSELEFRTLADTMPQMIWATRADGFHDYYNARWYEFTGVPVGTTDGERWNNMFHPDDQERAWAVWRQSLETGEPYQIEYRLRHRSGEYRWTLGRALPIRDASGNIVRWIGTCTDIHDSRRAAEERELVAQELSHRIKNIFAVLTGIVSLSARGRPDIKPFADQLRQRIFALGEAHDFVRPQNYFSPSQAGQGTLAALIARLTRAYEKSDGTSPVHYSGDDTSVDDAAATPLALIFHELATNSAKYGALSIAEGWVDITGRVDGERFHLTWKEHGGPHIAQPEASSGFGSKLIELSVTGQMRGEIERIWEDDGLRVELTMPLSSLLRSNRLRPAEKSEEVS